MIKIIITKYMNIYLNILRIITIKIYYTTIILGIF